MHSLYLDRSYHSQITGDHFEVLTAHAKSVDGSSLSNTMGTQGGGNPVDLKGLKGPPSLAEEEYRGEQNAQKEGLSMWGRPGGGAPPKNADGTIDARLRGAAQAAYNGTEDDMKNPAVLAKREAHRIEQQDYLKVRARELADATAEQQKADWEFRNGDKLNIIMAEYKNRPDVSRINGTKQSRTKTNLDSPMTRSPVFAVT